MKKRINKILWYGSELEEGKAKAPSASVEENGLDGLNEGELYIANNEEDPALFTRTSNDKIVRLGEGNYKPFKFEYNKDIDALVLSRTDGKPAHFLATGALSTRGLGNTEEGGTGGGMDHVYNVDDFSKALDSFNKVSETDTFNAYAIRSLYEMVKNIENSSTDTSYVDGKIEDVNKKIDVNTAYLSEWIERTEKTLQGNIDAVESALQENIDTVAGDLSTLQTTVNDFLTGTDTDTIINRWKELEAFLNGYTETATLADLLSGKADRATTLAGYGITNAYTKTEVDSKITSVNTSVTTLQTTVSGHTTSINSLQSTVSGHTSSITSINNKITTLQGYFTDGVAKSAVRLSDGAEYKAWGQVFFKDGKPVNVSGAATFTHITAESLTIGNTVFTVDGNTVYVTHKDDTEDSVTPINLLVTGALATRGLGDAEEGGGGGADLSSVPCDILPSVSSTYSIGSSSLAWKDGWFEGLHVGELYVGGKSIMDLLAGSDEFTALEKRVGINETSINNLTLRVTSNESSIADINSALGRFGALAYKDSLAFSELTNKPTTLSGYGITDGVTLNSAQTISGKKTFSQDIVGNITGSSLFIANNSTKNTNKKSLQINSGGIAYGDEIDEWNSPYGNYTDPTELKIDYGTILRLRYSTNYYHDIWFDANKFSIVYRKITNKVSAGWVTILDNLNFSTHLDSSYVKKSGDTITGKLRFTGSTYPHILGNGSVLVLSGSSSTNQLVLDYVTRSVRPSGSNAQSLGNSANRWSNVYSVLGNFSGQITSTVADGTAPFIVASKTLVSNLNADMLDGKHLSDVVHSYPDWSLSQYNEGEWAKFFEFSHSADNLSAYVVIDFFNYEAGAKHVFGRLHMTARGTALRTADVANWGSVKCPQIKITSDDGLTFSVWMKITKSDWHPYLKFNLINKQHVTYSTTVTFQDEEPTGTNTNYTVIEGGFAIKLSTPRTLWGQSFDGSGNVSGNLTGVGNIFGSGAILIHSSGSQGIGLAYNGEETKAVTLNATQFKPYDAANGLLDLGSSSARWKGIYGQSLNLSSTATVKSLIKSANNVPLRIESTYKEASIEYIGIDATRWVAGTSVKNITDSFGIWSGTLGDSVLTCLSSGNVGIGTTSPSYKLDVNGTFHASGNATVGGTLDVTGLSTFRNDILYNSGDATLKIYDVDVDSDNFGNEAVAIQTCFDHTDPETSGYVTRYEGRCNLLLQPRGGQVYVGYTPTSVQSPYALSVGQAVRLYGDVNSTNAPEIAFYRDGLSSWKIINNSGSLYFQNNYTTTLVTSSYFNVLTLAYTTGNATLKGSLTTGGNILPNSSGAGNIGTSSAKWLNGYINNLYTETVRANTIYLGSTAKLTYDSTLNALLLTRDDGTVVHFLASGAVATRGLGELDESGGGTGTGVDLLNVPSDIIPSVGITYSLGTSGKPWKELFVGDIQSENIMPSSHYTYSLGADENRWSSIYAVDIYATRFTMNGEPVATRNWVNSQSYAKASELNNYLQLNASTAQTVEGMVYFDQAYFNQKPFVNTEQGSSMVATMSDIPVVSFTQFLDEGVEIGRLDIGTQQYMLYAPSGGSVDLSNYVTLDGAQTITGSKTIYNVNVGSIRSIEFPNTAYIGFDSTVNLFGGLTIGTGDLKAPSIQSDNILPKSNGSGNIGSFSLTWLNGYFNSLYSDAISVETLIPRNSPYISVNAMSLDLYECELYGYDSDNIDVWNVDFAGNAWFLSVTQTSDVRYKNIKENVHLKLSDIAAAPTFKFSWANETDGSTHIGTSAQYWQEIAGELVVANKKTGKLGLDYSTAALVSAISIAREVNTMKMWQTSTTDRIEELEERVKSLKEENKALREMLNNNN